MTILLAACRGKQGDDNGPVPSASEDISTIPTATPLPTATPSPTATPTPTPEPTPTPLPSVQEVFEQTQYSGVYRMGLEFADSFIDCDINMVGGTPILVGSTDDYATKIYAIDPVKKTYKRVTYSEDSCSYSFMYINDEIFAVRNFYDGEYTVYDTELNNLGTIRALESYENAVIADGGETVWCLFETALRKRDREGNRIAEFPVNRKQLGGYLNEYFDRRYLTVNCYDKNDAANGSIVYDIEEWRILKTDGHTNRFFVSPDGTETLLVTDYEDMFAGLYDGGIEDCFTEQQPETGDGDGTGTETAEDAEPIIVRKTPKQEIKLSGNGETYISFMDWENRVYLTSTSYYSSNNTVFELKSYSVDTGEIVAEYAVAMGSRYVWPALSLDRTRGILFFTCGRTEDFALYCWDYVNDTANDSTEAFAKMTAVPGYIEEKRRAFEEKYNIRLYLGSEVFASPFDYRLTICNDWDKVEDGIDTLDEVFGNYPEGFFDQLKINDIKTLGIYICSGFEKIYSYSADDAIALACVFGYERALAIDMEYRYCLERTIVHEVSHWIDGKIDTAKVFGKCLNYEEDWNSLLPEGYSYKNSYVSGRTEWKYIYYYADLEDTYFCDEYSQTYSGEDKARCFEYLMYGERDGYMYMDAPRIQEKLALYFKYIREAFDDSTWPEKTIWEEKLDYYINDWTPDAGGDYCDDYDEDYYGDGDYDYPDYGEYAG